MQIWRHPLLPPDYSGSPRRVPGARRPAGNIWRGLRSLRDLTQHLTARADDNHAPSVIGPGEPGDLLSQAVPTMSSLGKVLGVSSY